jgi:alkylation response protein AidB-like acyl-CoA dehydrogenase
MLEQFRKTIHIIINNINDIFNKMTEIDENTSITNDEKIKILRIFYQDATKYFVNDDMLRAMHGYSWKDDTKYDFSYAHLLIDEMATFNMPLTAALLTSARIGLHSVIFYGSDKMKKKIVNECFNGNAILSLCMSGPEAGSDIFSMTTTATKTPENTWILNGCKKWITGGIYANYFVVVARTDDVSIRGNESSFSLFLVDAKNKGVGIEKMSCQGSAISGTARILFNDVVLTDDDIIGEIGGGFMMCMDILIEERWTTGVSSIGVAKCAFNECLRWINSREIHGTKMTKIQAVRMRIGEMKICIDQIDAYAEKLAYKLSEMRNNNNIDFLLGADTALFKIKANEVAMKCVESASQIFGGRAYEKTGPGSTIERLHRETHGLNCAGGTHDVLMDGAVRVFLKSKL